MGIIKILIPQTFTCSSLLIIWLASLGKNSGILKSAFIINDGGGEIRGQFYGIFFLRYYFWTEYDLLTTRTWSLRSSTNRHNCCGLCLAGPQARHILEYHILCKYYRYWESSLILNQLALCDHQNQVEYFRPSGLGI